jgi:hypothetical protein
MLKKTITYIDFNGTERTEDHYFNLMKSECIEMMMSADGDFEEMIKRIISSKNGALIMKTFKEIIMKSYGIKSLDGKRLEKSEEISKAFTETEAYSTLFMELCTDADAAAKFVNGILPHNVNSSLQTNVNTDLQNQSLQVVN